jgi:hypothetical protein
MPEENRFGDHENTQNNATNLNRTTSLWSREVHAVPISLMCKIGSSSHGRRRPGRTRGDIVRVASFCSERIILVCQRCTERTVLGEPLSVWRSEKTFFECECGNRLTLADRLEREDAELKEVAGASCGH